MAVCFEMSLLKQQNLLARIFTNKDLRQDFFENPESIKRELGLSETDLADLQKLSRTDLNFFADSLFYKRLQEVRKLLPHTEKFLQKDFQAHFRDFAANFQPKTLKKHLEDAVEFADFLSAKKFSAEFVRDIAIYEQSRLIFNNRQKNFILKTFSFDIRRLDDEKLPPRKTVAVWFRFGNLAKHYII